MNREAIEELYSQYCDIDHPTRIFLPLFRQLAEECGKVIELGTYTGYSATAWLLGCGNLITYDYRATEEAWKLKHLAGDAMDYRVMDTQDAKPEECDLLFVDAHHTYAAVKRELEIFGDHVRKFIVFHDTETNWDVGCDKQRGIGPAIVEFMADNLKWSKFWSSSESHGLLVLKCAG